MTTRVVRAVSTGASRRTASSRASSTRSSDRVEARVTSTDVPGSRAREGTEVEAHHHGVEPRARVRLDRGALGVGVGMVGGGGVEDGRAPSKRRDRGAKVEGGRARRGDTIGAEPHRADIVRDAIVASARAILAVSRTDEVVEASDESRRSRRRSHVTSFPARPTVARATPLAANHARCAH